MKLLVLAAALTASVHAAEAMECTSGELDEVIATCDESWSGSSFVSMSVRGWCYLVGVANCYLT